MTNKKQEEPLSVGDDQHENKDKNALSKDDIENIKETKDVMKNTQDIAAEVQSEQKKIEEDLSAKQVIEKLQNEVNEINDKYLRLYSEFENYKKRTIKERIELSKIAGMEIFSGLLPVIDDFERALKSFESINVNQNNDALKEGVDLIYNKLKNFLIQKGLEEMKSMGKDFDSDIHQAISNIPAPSEEMKGKVIDEPEKGYYLNGKVLRYAKVVVGS